MKGKIRDMDGKENKRHGWKSFKSNIHLKGVPEEKNKEKVRKEIVGKIIAKNLPDVNSYRHIISLKWYK